MMDKTLNILTRTSGRSNYFKDNHASVKSQTYPNIRHIVSVDDDESFNYVSKLADKIVRVERVEKKLEYGVMHSPYNLYCNKLMGAVEDGWIMFLDDDDILSDNESLNEIMNSVQDENELFIWKGQIHNKILPSYSFGKGIALCDIGSFCFMFHSKHIWAAQWDEVKESDFRAILKLSRILKVRWVDKLVAKVNNDSAAHGPAGVGLGDRKDKK